MQTNYMTREMHERLWVLLAIDDDRRRNGTAQDSDSCGGSEHVYPRDGSDGWSGKNNSDNDRLSLCQLVVAVPPGFALPKDKTVTISVIGGPAKGLICRLAKPHISVGGLRGGADIELDDPELSDMHCALGVKDSIIRLCDLDSHGGTYVEDQRVSAAPLEHLSEFRVGSSVLLLTVVPSPVASPAEVPSEFMREKEDEHSLLRGANQLHSKCVENNGLKVRIPPPCQLTDKGEVGGCCDSPISRKPRGHRGLELSL